MILFDADGVIQTTSDDFKPTLQSFLSNAADVDGFLKDIFVAELPSLIGKGDFADNLREVLKHWNICMPVEKVLNTWTLIKPIVGLETIIARLQQTGIMSCIASNQQSYRANYMSCVLDYGNIFHREFYSFALGVMKPNPDFFEKAKNALGVKASEMLFIDDNAMNVKSASDVGITAAMFNVFDHPDPAEALVEVLNQHGICL